MTTERIDPRFADLDLWETHDVVAALFESQLAAVAAIKPALPAIAAAITAITARLKQDGRLVYVGAGTSGRIGVQDGSELPPTFHWPRERVVFLIAGGTEALLHSVEGAEDDEAAGVQAVEAVQVGPADVVIGLAASGTTPYVMAAIRRARSLGALTIGIANNTGAPLAAVADHGLILDTGPEVIAGSTRMKAGTVQKVVLNMLSTGAMVGLGRVYGGIMVDMVPSNAKLRKRAAAIVMHIASCDADDAERALRLADNDIKHAVLIARGASREDAAARLENVRGDLRRALEAPRGRTSLDEPD
jgi:N-acetylmuramic acid 6-phosphate etherase